MDQLKWFCVVLYASLQLQKKKKRKSKKYYNKKFSESEAFIKIRLHTSRRLKRPAISQMDCENAKVLRKMP